MPREIVKVQLPLFSSEQSPPMLIYDQHKSRVVNCFRKTTRRKMLATGKPVAFFYANWHAKHRKWNIHDRAPTQEW